MAAITASSISTPGVVTSELPDSSRWDTTTARPDFRATSSRGSRPYGAKATRRHVEAEHLHLHPHAPSTKLAWALLRSNLTFRGNGELLAKSTLPPNRSLGVCENGIAKLSSRRSKRNVGKAHDEWANVSCG